jgi:hypothetical protein
MYIISETTTIAYVFRNADGNFLRLNLGEVVFSGVPTIFQSHELKEITKIIKTKKVKCKKFQVEIHNTIKLVGGMEDAKPRSELL